MLMLIANRYCIPMTEQDLQQLRREKWRLDGKAHPDHRTGARVRRASRILPDVSGAAGDAGADIHWRVRRLGQSSADLAACLF